MKIGLQKHQGLTKDTTGCEFRYTCLTNTYWMAGERKTERHYIVYNGKGTGLSNIVTEADSLKELKRKMGQL